MNTDVIIAAVGAAVVLLVLIVYNCLIVSSWESRREEQAERQQATAPGEPVEPCAECLRWPECNGVDPDCPLREEVAYGQDRA